MKEINSGYVIMRKSKIKNTYIVLAYNSTSPFPYVTWKKTNGRSYYSGHYFKERKYAVKDYLYRIKLELLQTRSD